jgi:flagellar secretion chaperone FliS
MQDSGSNEYLKNAVLSASQEQLTLMLYDGAIRFATQGREALAKCDFETSCEKLIRAQKIILELRNGLRFEVNPALCEQMAGLYDFVYTRLVDANIKRSLTLIDEAVRILRHQRETWQMLMDKVRSASANRAAADDAGAIGMSLCIEG